MNIDTRTIRGVTVVRLGPRLDGAHAKQFEEALLPLIEKEQSVVLDLAELEYMSSAGLRVVLLVSKAASERNGRMALSSAYGAVYEALVITGFDTMLGHYTTVAEATAALSGKENTP